MKVKCIKNKGKDLDANTLKIVHLATTEFQLNIGEIYVVYGMCLWKGIMHYLLVDKYKINPFWFPAELFRVIDNMLPLEWYYNFGGYGEEINAIWGYKELVLDESHYIGLIEREKKSIEVFLKRKKEIEEYADI